MKELKGKIRKNWFVLYDKNLFFIFIHIIIEFLTSVLTFSIDHFLWIKAGNNYKSDLLTGFKSNIFDSTSSRITNKYDSIANKA